MKLLRLPTQEEALAGRTTAIVENLKHFVNGRSLHTPYPENFKVITLGMGCFWGAEKLFWQLPGVYITAVGYAGGITPNPSYEEVCTGYTAHTECVRVVFDPEYISLAKILKVFFENHDSTSGMRQGYDLGTQYRSAIYSYSLADFEEVEILKDKFQIELLKAERGMITTEVKHGQHFYFAEEMHQQYLAKNPDGYCGLNNIGITCPV